MSDQNARLLGIARRGRGAAAHRARAEARDQVWCEGMTPGMGPGACTCTRREETAAMNGTRRTFDDLAARAAALMLAVGRLGAVEERGEAIHVEAALGLAWDRLAALDRALATHAEAWRRGPDAGVDRGGG